MKKHKILFSTILLILILFLVYWVVFHPTQQLTDNHQELATAQIEDLVIIDFPKINSVVSSPIIFSGQARGTYFFEASFPVILVDWDGEIIAQGFAQAQSDWMTEDFVPFTGQLEFTRPAYGDSGTLIFRKDNPSGLPEHSNALEFKIFFE